MKRNVGAIERQIQGSWVMAIAGNAHAVSPVQATRNYGWMIAGYGLLAAIALVALYFASGGPGNGEAALAAMVAMP